MGNELNSNFFVKLRKHTNKDFGFDQESKCQRKDICRSKGVALLYQNVEVK